MMTHRVAEAAARAASVRRSGARMQGQARVPHSCIHRTPLCRATGVDADPGSGEASRTRSQSCVNATEFPKVHSQSGHEDRPAPKVSAATDGKSISAGGLLAGRASPANCLPGAGSPWAQPPRAAPRRMETHCNWHREPCRFKPPASPSSPSCPHCCVLSLQIHARDFVKKSITAIFCHWKIGFLDQMVFYFLENICFLQKKPSKQFFLRNFSSWGGIILFQFVLARSWYFPQGKSKNLFQQINNDRSLPELIAV